MDKQQSGRKAVSTGVNSKRYSGKFKAAKCQLCRKKTLKSYRELSDFQLY